MRPSARTPSRPTVPATPARGTATPPVPNAASSVPSGSSLATQPGVPSPPISVEPSSSASSGAIVAFCTPGGEIVTEPLVAAGDAEAAQHGRRADETMPRPQRCGRRAARSTQPDPSGRDGGQVADGGVRTRSRRRRTPPPAGRWRHPTRPAWGCGRSPSLAPGGCRRPAAGPLSTAPADGRRRPPGAGLGLRPHPRADRVDSASGRPAIASAPAASRCTPRSATWPRLGPDGSGWVMSSGAAPTTRCGRASSRRPARRACCADWRRRPLPAHGHDLPTRRSTRRSRPLLALEDGSTLIGGDRHPRLDRQAAAGRDARRRASARSAAVPARASGAAVRIVGVRAGRRIGSTHPRRQQQPRPVIRVAWDPTAPSTPPMPPPRSASAAAGHHPRAPSTPGGTTLSSASSTLRRSSKPTGRSSWRRLAAPRGERPVRAAGVAPHGPDGEYDAHFGLGVPAQGQTAAGRLVTFTQPVAGAGD